MAGGIKCGWEALDIDCASSGDAKARAGSNDEAHDKRQGLVSPFSHPKSLAPKFIPRVARISPSTDVAFQTLCRLGRIRTFRGRCIPQAPETQPCRRRSLSADGEEVAQSQAKLRRTSASPPSTTSKDPQLPMKQSTWAGSRVVRRLQRSEKTTVLLSAANAPFQIARQVTRQLHSNLKHIHHVSKSTRPTQSSAQSQPQEDTTPSIPLGFPRRRLFDRSKGELNALAEASGRLRTEDHVKSTKPPESPRAVYRKLEVLKSLKTALRTIERGFDKLNPAIQEVLRQEKAGVEHQPENESRGLEDSTPTSQQKIALLETSLTFLESLRQRLVAQEVLLQELRRSEEGLEHGLKLDVPIRRKYSVDLRRVIMRLVIVRRFMDSARQDLSTLYLLCKRKWVERKQSHQQEAEGAQFGHETPGEHGSQNKRDENGK